MIITADNLFSWPTAIWLGAGICVIGYGWGRTQRIFNPWKRTLWRAFVIALAFTPTVIPTAAEFESVLRTPAWYALFVGARDWNLVALFAGIVPVFLAAVILWTLGMALHLLKRIR